MREKLIELLGYETCKDKECIGCKHYSNEAGCIDYLKAEIADHLIANGVTVQKWIPVTERLPEKTGRYLTANIRADDERCVFDLWFECGEWYIDEGDDLFIYKVTHWKPLPDPPKGE